MNISNIFFKTIEEQQRLIYDVLGRSLKKGMKVALLDFPNHNNVGDNAIWLGEKAALKKIGIEVVYQCDIYSYSEKALRKRLNNGGIVLLHGGGNLGCVWPEHQNFRERIIESLTDMHIIQLPQSVHFEDESRKLNFGQIARMHPNLDFLVRDNESLEILEKLGLKVERCPDMALAIGPVSRAGKPIVDIVWLSRTDHETSKQPRQKINGTIEKLDWFHGEPGKPYTKYTEKFTVRLRRMIQGLYKKSAFLRDKAGSFHASFFDILARQRFQRGIRILGRGEVVLTDRLHGHIISTLLGKQQILLDNHYRKIGNYLDCFSVKHEALFYVADEKNNIDAAISNAFQSLKEKNYGE